MKYAIVAFDNIGALIYRINFNDIIMAEEEYFNKVKHLRYRKWSISLLEIYSNGDEITIARYFYFPERKV